MDLHLDDRLLHGRILHGWGTRLAPSRYVLVSGRLADEAAWRPYRDAAAGAGADLLYLNDGEDAPPAPRTGEFWLTDSPAAALWLLANGPAPERLLLIGLRDAEGRALPGDFRVSQAHLADLLRLADAGVAVFLQRFPTEAPLPLTKALNDDEGRN